MGTRRKSAALPTLQIIVIALVMFVIMTVMMVV
ncbi:MAG: hypothetical protein QOI40_4575, partial [Alphaproteobacteria bacterium]|nr:hypothetical protein [Alphaproteobacteria bacterium]